MSHNWLIDIWLCHIAVKQVFKDLDFLGWYNTGELNYESDIHIHKQVPVFECTLCWYCVSLKALFAPVYAALVSAMEFTRTFPWLQGALRPDDGVLVLVLALGEKFSSPCWIQNIKQYLAILWEWGPESHYLRSFTYVLFMLSDMVWELCMQ